MTFLRSFILLLSATLAAARIFDYQPQQVHLSFGEKTSEFIVTWSTMDNPGASVVEYGIRGLILRAEGHSKLFVDGGAGKHRQYIHRVRLTNLQPDSRYTYHCGSERGWSPLFWFKTPPEGPDFAPHLAIFGDMGNENAQSVSYLQEETQRGLYDAIIHVGDFAYDMDSENAAVGDQFMRQIEEIAAYVPYMVCAGNHEEKYNFSNYRSRFSMPGDSEGLFFSFNLGPVHFVSISTEVYYFLNYGLKQLVKQYEWLEQDLAAATQPESRRQRPWIIVYGHRPMYCSNSNDNDCTHHETLTRVGLPFTHFFGMEDLLARHGVDVAIWAHEHSYERLWPLYNYTVYNGSLTAPYTNPGAPVHLVTGSAGCKEGREPFKPQAPAWSAFHSQDYGYTRLRAHNATHLHFEQVSVDRKGDVIDEFWLVRERHERFDNLL